MPDRPIRILELRSVRGTGGGPEKTILYGTARTDPARFAITVCYIRDRRDNVFALHELAASLCVDYVEVLERHSFDPSIWSPLRRLIRDRRIDIVHAHEYKTDLLALLLAKAEGITPLATAHGWTGHSRRELALYYPADRYVLRQYPAVIAVSEQIRQTLIDAGSRPDRIVTILNGIDPGAFVRQPGRGAAIRAELGLPEGATVLGSIGRLEPQKRFDLLINAFASLQRQRPDLRLVIAGDGSLAGALEAQVRALGLESCCHLLGHRTDVRDVVQAFTLFVQSSDYEGTPNAVLEAMALEAPVVATTAGGTAQLIEHDVHGLLLSPGDAGRLAAAIGDALDRPAAMASWAHAARLRIERDLSFDNRMRAVERVYEGLAGRSPGRRTAPAVA